MAKEKVLGTADFGAFMHRDDGGRMKIAAYTSVNKPLSVEAHDETVKIASRRYKIVEEEKAELNGNKFYEKDVWNIQEGGSEKPSGEKVSEHFRDVDEVAPEPKAYPEQHSTATLKNMIDNILADNRVKNILLFIVLAIAVTALLLNLVR